MIFSRFTILSGSAFGRSQLFGYNEACPEDSLAGSENCVAAKERELTDCIFYCKLDTTCISECNRDHVTQLEKCPCYDQCYTGCPCEYESEYCDTENDVHLLIFSPHPFNQQRKFSWYFNENDEPSREVVQPVALNPTWTSRFFMCSFVNSGKRIMVGGYSENPETGAKLDRSQVQVRETDMVQLEDLEFDFYNGRCATYQNKNGEDRTLLCASGSKKGETDKKCYEYDGESYYQVGDTKVSHYQGDIVAYRDGAVIIAGGNLGTNYDGLSEVYSPGTASWSDLNKSETVAWLTEFASVNVNGNIFVFGGQFNVPTRPNMDVIRLNLAGEWSKVEGAKLPRWRFSFRARAVGNKIFLIGGPDVQTIECWRWNDDESMTVFESQFTTSWYNTYPETFIIGPSDYNPST